MTASRRLAAIAVADVVGYSRLMESDEAGTLQALKERRKTILEPVVRAHGGRIVKLMGDGALIEFASAVNAVVGALELQRRMAAANATMSEDRHIVLRIGINLGDVIGEGSDIYGDGVNIAARLEALAEPGGICVSAKVHDEVRGKLTCAFEDMGGQSLKNIAAPVRAYRAGPAAGAAEARTSLPDKPSIAVLPFINMSGDPEQQYFSDGITEDIITGLSRFRQLFVLARNSSFQYRGKDVDVKRIGRELGARYVVEGSVRKLKNRIRVTAQLIDAASGSHVWAESYDRGEQEIFAVQDQLIQTLVATLVGRVKAASAGHAKRKPPNSLAAYDYILRANALHWGEPQDNAEAHRLVSRAVELDPSYATAHATLAAIIVLACSHHAAAPHAAPDRALEHARQAVELDENDSACQATLGWIYMKRESFDLAEDYIGRALEMNPNSTAAMLDMCMLLTSSGRPDEAIEWIERAKRVDPYFQSTLYWEELGFAHFTARRYDQALAAFERSPRKPYWQQGMIAACHAWMGRSTDAEASAAAALRLRPDCSATAIATLTPYKKRQDREHLIAGLRKAGLPG